MTQSSKLWVVPLAVLLSFPAVAWALGSGFGLTGRALYILQGGAAGLGAMAAAGGARSVAGEASLGGGRLRGLRNIWRGRMMAENGGVSF
jgi:hypothetical protein